MSRDPKNLECIKKLVIGKWFKKTKFACSDLYPDELEFYETGVYLGKRGEFNTDFTLWDAGEFFFVTNKIMKISTANDEEIQYSFNVNNEILTFKDIYDCEFSYGKIQNS